MKKVLILAYYYPPNNNIPSWRPHSWATYFSSREHINAEVHVVCRYWDGSEKTWEEQVKPSPNQRTYIAQHSKNHFVHYLATNSRLKKVLRYANAFLPVRKLFHLGVNLLGHYHLEVDTYFSYRKYIRKKFPKDYFDAVIVTSPPLNVIRLGHSLRNYFPSAFFVADFRDLWNNEILNENYKPKSKDRFYDKLNTRSLRKWLKSYNLVTSVSKGLTDKIEELGESKTGVITNGYEDDLFLELKKEAKKTFNITSIGTIYPHQEYKMLANGIIDFVKQNNFDPVIRVEFIGARAYNKSLCELLEKELPENILFITDRIDRRAALQLTKNADILVYPGWPGYKGRYSGKIFEYLAAGNNILIAPGDNDVIDQLLVETNAGVSINTREEVARQLQEWFAEWKQTGFVRYAGKTENIVQYSRENQSEKLASLIGLINCNKPMAFQAVPPSPPAVIG